MHGFRDLFACDYDNWKRATNSATTRRNGNGNFKLRLWEWKIHETNQPFWGFKIQFKMAKRFMWTFLLGNRMDFFSVMREPPLHSL